MPLRLIALLSLRDRSSSEAVAGISWKLPRNLRPWAKRKILLIVTIFSLSHSFLSSALAHADLKIDVSRFDNFEQDLCQLVKSDDFLDVEGVYIRDFKLLRVPRETAVVQPEIVLSVFSLLIRPSLFQDIETNFPKYLQTSLRYYNAEKYFQVKFSQSEELATNIYSRKKAMFVCLDVDSSHIVVA